MDICSNSNRFELVCEEELDPYDILEQAGRIQKLTLNSSKAKEASLKEVRFEKSAAACDVPLKGGGHLEGLGRGDSVGPKVKQQNVRSSNLPGEVAGPDVGTYSKEPWISYEKPKIPQKSFRGRGAMPRRGVIPKRDGFNERGKREFDRQSGSPKSGVKAVAKREGGGAHNWGRPSDDFETTREVIPEEGAEDSALENPDTKIGVEQAKPDESAGEMTLEEWKQHEKSSRYTPSYKLRKPGEGVDSSQWDKAYVLKKKTDEVVSSEDDSAQAQKGARKKSVKPVEVLFGDQAGIHGGRGGRDGKRGRRKKSSGDQNSVPWKPAPQLDDLADFPSLGGK